MSLNSEGQQPSITEKGLKPEYQQEIVQYKDDQLALRITGELGTKFDFNTHKYSPTEPGEEAIVSTKSGNDYHIFTRSHRTYIINTRESEKRKSLVATAYDESSAELPPLEFGEPWKIPGFYTTSGVQSVLLRYKTAIGGHTVGRMIDEPNPFDNYQRLLQKSQKSG